MQKGTRLGNWLTREQAKELLAVPDRSTLKGKRDYVIIALLGGCALRRRELASLTIEDIHLPPAKTNRFLGRFSSTSSRPASDASYPLSLAPMRPTMGR
jgi:site-specific recombinase XerD